MRIQLTVCIVILCANLFGTYAPIDTTSIAIDSTVNVTIEVDGPKYVSGSAERFPVSISATNEYRKPMAGVKFKISSVYADGLEFESNEYVTDSLGKASCVISGYSKSGRYGVLFSTASSKYQLKPKYYEFNVRAENWVFVMVVGLLGGLSLFLLGMNMMSKGMQNSAGDKLRSILNKLTNNRFVAVAVGAVITTVIQSSSATNVMLVSFVNSRLMRFKQTIGIILGAAIGTTITAQIIAFKLTDYALVFVTIGLSMYFMSKKLKLSEIGKAILGFGILFFGMHVMSESMYPLRTYQPFINLIIHLEAPVIGILVGVIFTALIQSSSAFIGILIILAMQGMLTLEASISLVIGANMGTAVTALLASINTSKEAKQVAIAHTLIKIFGALIFIPLLPFFTEIIEHLGQNTVSSATPREIANAHTIYNVVLCALILPFTNSVTWVVNKIFPVDEHEQPELAVNHIDINLIKAPSLALKAARDELIRMMEEVQKMARTIMVPFFDKNIEVISEIEASEDKVDFLRDSITEFLIELTRNDISEGNVQEAFIYLNAVREYEEIADVISTQLKKRALSWCKNSSEFSVAGRAELDKYHKLTTKILKKSIQVYRSLDIKEAKKLKDRYYVYREEYFELEKNHYERLQDNVAEAISSSKTHLELITLFKVICSHATNTAHIIIRKETGKKKKTKK